MHFSISFSIAAAALVGTVLASPMQVRPGGIDQIIITPQNLLDASAIENDLLSAAGQLNITVSNNLNESINVYVTGLDTDDNLVLLLPNGTYFQPENTTSAVPVAITQDVAISAPPGNSSFLLPSYISSARVWFAEGDLQFFVVAGSTGPSLVEPSSVNPTDPSADIDWGFIELTWTAAGGLFANISYVDFVGLILGISLVSLGSATQYALGLETGAVASICAALVAQSAIDGQPWGDLCVYSTSGAPLRIIAPYDYMSLYPTAFSTYYTAYTASVWATYAANNLTFDTQGSPGDVSCLVLNGTLTCGGDNRGYAPPAAADVFGCNSGPFAIAAGDNAVHVAVVPRLCAAFDRSTLLLPGGNVQPGLPAADYYTVDPTNWYAKLVHEFEVDGQGYAFSYDDVTPTGAPSAAGAVDDLEPFVLNVFVGGQP